MAQHEKKFFSLNGFVLEIHDNRVNAARAFWGGVALALAGAIIATIGTPLALIGTIILGGVGAATAIYAGYAWANSKFSDQAEPGI